MYTMQIKLICRTNDRETLISISQNKNSQFRFYSCQMNPDILFYKTALGFPTQVDFTCAQLLIISHNCAQLTQFESSCAHFRAIARKGIAIGNPRLHSQFNYHSLPVGFPIAIPLRAIARKCAQLLSNCVQLREIARNYAQLRAIFKSLQGSHLRASKIHLRWKPYKICNFRNDNMDFTTS